MQGAERFQRIERIVSGHGIAQPARTIAKPAVWVGQRMEIGEAGLAIGGRGAELFERAQGGPGVGDVVHAAEFRLGLIREAALGKLTGTQPGNGFRLLFTGAAQDAQRLQPPPGVHDVAVAVICGGRVVETAVGATARVQVIGESG